MEDSTSNTNVMFGLDLVNVSISNINFDLNGAMNLTPPGKTRNAYAILILGGNALSIKNNFFHNSSGRNMLVIDNHGGRRGSNAIVSGNTLKDGGYFVGFRSGAPVENVNNTDFSFIYVVWDDSEIEGNWIEEGDPSISLQHPAGGIEVHASNTKAVGNTLIGLNPAFFVASAPGPKENIMMSENKIRNCIRGVSFYMYDGNLTNISIVNNHFELTAPIFKYSPPCAAIIVPTGGLQFFDKAHQNAGYAERVYIINNTIVNNFASKSEYPCDGMVLHSLHGAKISHNDISGMTGTGILLLGSPWGNQDLEISNNRIMDCGRAKTGALRAGIYFNQSGYSKTPPSQFHAENVTINGNILGNTDSRAYMTSGITFEGLGASKLKGLNVSSNTFSGVAMKLSDGRNEINTLETLNPEAHSRQ
jgi:hypothetical protein